ncbi:unnamed protein product [Angiostrongylus costaricensis]|uniref:Late endosomal/lysosomal adaptor and MAPK and MTOR activator 1 n=1 Tax=Angiostrongylus costaricensis TaxID=334426 RepID=A0A0R3PK41_ANGCS|nr:unnamed protein product [Angiostrongylus costaricensis]
MAEYENIGPGLSIDMLQPPPPMDARDINQYEDVGPKQISKQSVPTFSKEGIPQGSKEDVPMLSKESVPTNKGSKQGKETKSGHKVDMADHVRHLYIVMANGIDMACHLVASIDGDKLHGATLKRNFISEELKTLHMQQS